MKASTRKTTKTAAFLWAAVGAWLAWAAPAAAESDKELQEMALKAREMNQKGRTVDHSAHVAPDAAGGQFRGVFYGYLPCREENCKGLKMTLSLNAKNRYLLVSQPAKVLGNRESFEKGSYEWNDAKGTLVLTPYKDAPQRKLAIKEEGVLLYLSDDETFKSDRDRYLLQRTDKAGNREMHIH